MAVGYPVTLADVNNMAGRLVVATWQSLDDVRRFTVWLNDSAHNAAYTAGLGMAGADDTTLRAAFADLDSLRQIAHATGAKGVANIGSSAAANDFFFNAKNLSGLTNTTT